MLVPVIVALVVFALFLLIVSFKMKRFDAEVQMEEMNINHAAEMYAMNQRLSALEEEMLWEVEE